MKPKSSKNNENIPLDKTGKWFRDLLMKLLGWGTATFIVMAGWLLPGQVEFSFFTSDRGDFYRAFGLLFFSTFFWLPWFIFVNKIRQKCPDHPTILKRIKFWGFLRHYFSLFIYYFSLCSMTKRETLKNESSHKESLQLIKPYLSERLLKE